MRCIYDKEEKVNLIKGIIDLTAKYKITSDIYTNRSLLNNTSIETLKSYHYILKCVDSMNLSTDDITTYLCIDEVELMNINTERLKRHCCKVEMLTYLYSLKEKGSRKLCIETIHSYTMKRVLLLYNYAQWGVDIVDLIDSKLSDAKVEFSIKYKLRGTKDIVSLVSVVQSDKHLDALEYSILKGEDFLKKSIPYFKQNYSVEKLFEILKGIDDGIDVDKYANPKYTINQMKLIKRGLYLGYDVSKYASISKDAALMGIILKALNLGINVKDIKDDRDIKDLEKQLNVMLYSNKSLFDKYDLTEIV